ncbi:MAG TPA: TetR/AcrR family transcriptional regulator [Actinomycetota bacterium]|nr:TetR/AcrR family transcriptional regulator [Actinomycetota bacterium]
MGSRPKLTRQRRMEILEAAVEMIVERGLPETRVADVAERAGTSAALVLYYFDSKDRLLTEALSYVEDRFYLQAFHDLTGIDSASERLAVLIARSCPPSGGDANGDWRLWFELWTRALRDPETARKRAALDRRWRATIADVVRDGQRSGEFASVDADDLALELASLIDGLAIQVVLEDPEVGPDRMRRICLEAAGRALEIDLSAFVPAPSTMTAPRTARAHVSAAEE